MYPFDTDQPFVRNRWYLAGFAGEFGREPIEKTLLDTPVVFYRTVAGSLVAMYGLCPHRYFPLAQGKVIDDSIACGYHGFVFGPEGKCTHIPSQGTGGGFCQPVYRTVEQGPLVWIWMGDAKRCNPDLIPPCEDYGLGIAGWQCSSFNHFVVKARAQLLIDNLLDLTHLPYIHHHVPGGEAMKAMPMREVSRAESYRLVRTGKLPWTGFSDRLWGPENRYEGLADWESITDFYGPELIRTNLPLLTKVPGHEGIPAVLGELHILHAITPETAKTTHYFGFATRNFRLGDIALDEFQLESDRHIRAQDIVAVEAVEVRVDFGAQRQRELLVKADAPGTKVRQRIAAMLKDEA